MNKSIRTVVSSIESDIDAGQAIAFRLIGCLQLHLCNIWDIIFPQLKVGSSKDK